MSFIREILTPAHAKILALLLALGTGGWTVTLYFHPVFWAGLVEREFNFYARFPWIPKSYLVLQRNFCLSRLFRQTVTLLLLLSLFCLGILLCKTGKST